MLFTNTGAENITVINSQGVRSAQCSMEFDIAQKFVPEPSLNFSVVIIFWIILCGYLGHNEIYCNEQTNFVLTHQIMQALMHANNHTTTAIHRFNFYFDMQPLSL